MSRTINAIRNIIFGFINKIVMLFFPFVLRTIIIQTLGTEFLGLNSLFTSILQVLNLAELGIGSAIIYSMYAPIAKKDTDTICALLNLYKRIYRLIGCLILCCGLLLLPFLKTLINGTYPTSINLYIIFVLYLINTSISYFLFAYKSSLLIAHQRNDITSNILTICSIFQYVSQILVLYLTHNYYLFIIFNIISTLLNNIIVSRIVDKVFPQYKCIGTIDNNTKNSIKLKTIGLMIQKICGTTRNSFDSIFISLFLGLNMVAIYSNYYTILTALVSLFGVFSVSIISGIGNSIVTESIEKNYNDMVLLNFIYMTLAGVATIGMLCLYQPFMEIWMGKEMLLPFDVVILFCLYFYLLKMGDIRMVYSDAKGLWWENRYRAIIEVIINIVLNYFLGRFFGLKGILWATIISIFFVNYLWSSKILFKYYFTNYSILKYYKDNFVYAIVTVIIGLVSFYIVGLIQYNGVIGFVIKTIVCVLVTSVCYLVAYFNTKNFKNSVSFCKKLIQSKKGV